MRKEFKNVKAKHGLNKKNWIRAIGLSFLRDQKHKRREEKGRRRRRGRRKEEEEKRMRKEEQKVWNYEFLYEFPCNCMVSSLPQTWGLIGFHPNMDFLKVGLVKP